MNILGNEVLYPTQSPPAMFATILEQPHSYAPRRVLADWLEETGDPTLSSWGEFIRVQCVLAALYKSHCKSCGEPLTHDRLCDGCPCNSPRGVNHGSVPSYLCTCPICDPQETGAPRVRPSEIDQLYEREAELWHSIWPQVWDSLRRLVPEQTPKITPAKIDCGGTIFSFRAGFLSQITCTTSTWTGIRCSRCLGRRWVCSNCDGLGHTHPTRDLSPGDLLWDEYRCPDCEVPGLFFNTHPCPDCQGSGSTMALGSALASIAPITWVKLSDRRPDGRWWWDDRYGAFEANPAYLPTQIFNHLPFTRMSSNTFSAYYSTRGEAIKALCGPDGAALKWAKSPLRVP